MTDTKGTAIVPTTLAVEYRVARTERERIQGIATDARQTAKAAAALEMTCDVSDVRARIIRADAETVTIRCERVA